LCHQLPCIRLIGKHGKFAVGQVRHFLPHISDMIVVLFESMRSHLLIRVLLMGRIIQTIIRLHKSSIINTNPQNIMLNSSNVKHFSDLVLYFLFLKVWVTI